MPPPETLVLGSGGLQNVSVDLFITKYGGDMDRIEGQSWGETVRDWVQSIASWSEEDLFTNTKSSLELWNKEENEYFATRRLK
jgi:hypothetical protein